MRWRRTRSLAIMSGSNMVSITMLPPALFLGKRRTPIVSPLVCTSGPWAWRWPSAAATGKHNFKGIGEHKKLQDLRHRHGVLQRSRLRNHRNILFSYQLLFGLTDELQIVGFMNVHSWNGKSCYCQLTFKLYL